MIRLEGPTLPTEARGAVPPILFGELLQDVPGIPLQVGWAATLADNCGIEAGVTTLRLGGADLAEVLAAVPAAGVVQLEQEWLRYDAILANPPRLAIAERGYRETVPAAHAKGTTVYFVETRPLYVFAFVPPGCSYPDDWLVQLRVNDQAETPPATVRLQDERLVPGVRLVTVEFDASRAFYTPPAPVLPSHVVLGAAPGNPAALGRGVGPLRMGGPAAQQNPAMRLWLPPPPRIHTGLSPGPFTANGGQRVVSLRQGALGRVTVDCRGLRDTPAGRYSGVPLGGLVQPAAIVRLLLEETYGETDPGDYHAPSWAATAARHAQRGLTWRLLWRGEAFESFREAAQVCGQADLYLDEEGRWRYAFRDPLGPTVGTLTARELLDEPAVGWSAGREVVTELEVAWGEGRQGGTLTLDSPHMRDRHGRNHGGLALPYAATEPIARQLGRYELSRRDRPRQSVTVRTSHAWLGLTVADRVFVDTPLLQLYGAKRVPFEIVGLTDRGAERVLVLLEGDPLARELPLAGTLTLGGLLELELAGTLDTAVLAQVLALAGTLVRGWSLSLPLGGTLGGVTPGLVSLPLAGTLGAGAVLVLPLAGTLIRPATPRVLALTGTLTAVTSVPLAGTLVTGRLISRDLVGTLEGAPPMVLWDAVGATWDAAGATWDGVAGPAVTPSVVNAVTDGAGVNNGALTLTITPGAGGTYLVYQAGTAAFFSTVPGLTSVIATPVGGGTAVPLSPLVNGIGKPSSPGRRLFVWGGAGAVPGTAYNVVATWTGNLQIAHAALALANVGSVGTAALDVDGNATATASIATGGAEGLVLDAAVDNGAATYTPDAGQTALYAAINSAGQVGMRGSSKVGTGAVTCTITIGGGGGDAAYAAIPFLG